MRRKSEGGMTRVLSSNCLFSLLGLKELLLSKGRVLTVLSIYGGLSYFFDPLLK